jgi:hypothetical protein
MKHIFVRPARQNEAEQFLEWSVANKDHSSFDPEIARQPGTFVLAAYNCDKVVAYIPVHRPFMLESLAPNPEASDFEVASALREFTQFLVSQCHIKNDVGHIYFLGNADDTNKFASNHVYEELPWRVYRARVSDLEPKPEG